MDRPEEINECFIDLGPEALEVELYVNTLEYQRNQLREALDCWPLKELMGMVEDSGDAQILERLLWFSEVRDAALKATEEG